jgi:hypothetical protein
VKCKPLHLARLGLPPSSVEANSVEAGKMNATDTIETTVKRKPIWTKERAVAEELQMAAVGPSLRKGQSVNGSEQLKQKRVG